MLDASVLIQWFDPVHTNRSRLADLLRRTYEAGDLIVVVPTLASLEILNVAARKWRWERAALEALAADLSRIGLTIEDPTLESVAAWASTGLTACDASYVALAEELGIPLVTGDQFILDRAPSVAQASL